MLFYAKLPVLIFRNVLVLNFRLHWETTQMKLNKEQVKKFVQEKTFKTAEVITRDEIQTQTITAILNDIKSKIKKTCHIIILEEQG